MSDMKPTDLSLSVGSAWKLTDKASYGGGNFERTAVIVAIINPDSQFELVRFTRILREPDGNVSFAIFEWLTHMFLEDYERAEDRGGD